MSQDTLKALLLEYIPDSLNLEEVHDPVIEEDKEFEKIEESEAFENWGDFEHPLSWDEDSPQAQGEPTRSGFQIPGKHYPLHIAAKKGDLVEIQKLIDEGYPVNQEDNKSAMPIHVASLFGQLDAVKLLIQHGGDLKDKSYFGQTALHWAVVKGHSAVVEALVKAGANPLDRTNHHENALDLALNQLNQLYNDLVKYPQDTLLISQAGSLSAIVETLIQNIKAPAFFQDIDDIPVGLVLDAISTRIPDDHVRSDMQAAAQRIMRIDNSAELYLKTKLFLNTFATGKSYTVKLNDNLAITIHTDGFFSKYLVENLAQSTAHFSEHLKTQALDQTSYLVSQKIAQHFELAHHLSTHCASFEASQKAYGAYQSGAPLLLSTGWKGHAIAVLFSKNLGLFGVANAGEQYEEDTPGITFYRLNDPELITPQTMHELLTNESQENLEFKLPYLFEALERVDVIKTPPQVHGNCTYYSLKIAVEGLAYLEFLSQNCSNEDAQQKAHEFCSAWEKHHHTWQINSFLTPETSHSMEIIESVYRDLKKQSPNSLLAEKAADYLSLKTEEVFSHKLESSAGSEGSVLSLKEIIKGWLPFYQKAAHTSETQQSVLNPDDMIDNGINLSSIASPSASETYAPGAPISILTGLEDPHVPSEYII